MFSSENLKKASAAFAQHRDAVRNALQEYREAVARCDAHYAPDYAKQKIAESKAVAAGKVAQADKTMHDAVVNIAKMMRNNMYAEITAKPSEEFCSIVKEYNRYHLKMTEVELRAFAERAAGTYVGLRILQGIASDSGFRLSVPSVTDVEGDIKRIERAAWVPSMYTPLEYVQEAEEVFGGIPQFRADGSVWDRKNKADAAYLATINHIRERLENDLENTIPERWANMGPVKIEPIANDATGETGEDEIAAAAERAAAEQSEFANSLQILTWLRLWHRMKQRRNNPEKFWQSIPEDKRKPRFIAGLIYRFYPEYYRSEPRRARLAFPIWRVLWGHVPGLFWILLPQRCAFPRQLGHVGRLLFPGWPCCRASPLAALQGLLRALA